MTRSTQFYVCLSHATPQWRYRTSMVLRSGLTAAEAREFVRTYQFTSNLYTLDIFDCSNHYALL